MTTEEQKKFDQLTRQCTPAIEQLNKCTASLQHANTTINQLSTQLDQATKDNNRLVQFIKGKGIEPPPTFAA
jgi:multidrug resistance efflux pump